MPTSCGICGLPAKGFASINDERYCHGDSDEGPTCYERAVMAHGFSPRFSAEVEAGMDTAEAGEG